MTFARLGLAAALGVAALTTGAPLAGAAGGGYGPSAAVPGAVPGGFIAVVIARTLPPHGGIVRVYFGGVTVSVSVPPGALCHGGQVAITRGNLEGTRRGLTGKLRGHTPVFGAGFVIDHNGRALRSCKTIVITFTGPSLKVGDLIMEYKAGRFVQVGVVTVNGTATIDVRGVTEIVILAPTA